MTKVDLEKRRLTRLRGYAIDQARARFDADYPNFQPEEIVVSICAYEEEGNIGDVLAKMPESIDGRPYTTFVMVDGGDDNTATIARTFDKVHVMEFPVNLGHGVALQVTYRYCIEKNVRYVVTLDADGQNDPGEIPQVLAPLLADEADFVVASRVLGVDKTSDVVRKSGVRFFSFVMNRMTGANLTDTSTGYRALRVTMLADVIDRLEQEQYQTAELLITCLKRGWRAGEVPTVWYPRASGTTKKGKNWLFGFRYARVVFGTWWRER
ncbi:MAG: glycosyltransferase family 2 protein [Acidobacteriota bacterium]|nr:glycosyltransferase family 2 protein [Acidobacteriota bacterium]MDE3043801.1 glycosyltransferase family 2 protein [Acidobacteriota bacterium]MDE3106695.1 glycosyltransferase family 2 protein [Acidobacteriota bacterium]MDE3223233.1 glycosyltransferase family 2 protein [Acidobacteriota bacterium]